MDNPFGRCTHTKYNGCPPCVHDAWVRGVADAAKQVAQYSADNHRHVTDGVGLCSVPAGDRCDLTAVLRHLEQVLRDSADRSWKEINR